MVSTSPRASLLRVHDYVPSQVEAAVDSGLSLALGLTSEPPRDPLAQLGNGGVFVLVNHVFHQRPDESPEEYAAKVTSAEVIRAVVDWLAQSTGSRRSITVGNAPLQACDYEKMRVDAGIEQMLAGWSASDRPEIMDLRGYVSTWNRLRAKLSEERREETQGVEVDLGMHSLLEPLYSDGRDPQFRVMDYSSEEINKYHAKGRHVYVINRALLDSSLIVSVPKLKTHQKVGLTCGIKGTVGAIFLKQCLAHHRHGGAGSGGDELSPDNAWHRAVSNLAARTDGLGTEPIDNLQRVLSKVAYRASRIPRDSFMGGAWYGNDTAWRMSIDIARVLRFARSDGSLADTPQRQHVVFVDGIIAGEGEGPLRPSPRNDGVLIAGSDPLAADVLCGLAMGWDPRRLAILSGAINDFGYPVSDASSLDDIQLGIGGDSYTLRDAPTITSRPFAPPKGWPIELLEWANPRT